MKAAEAEGLDDEIAETTDASRCDSVRPLVTTIRLEEKVYSRDRNNQDEPQPGLSVYKSLNHVIPSPFPTGDSHLICPQTFYGDDLFPLLEIFGFHG